MRVDIPILTYNRSFKLEKCITSILKQTYQDIKIIVIDDCSIDDTEQVVSSFNDSRIVYVKNKKNLGMFENWIYALSLIESDFFLPMIGDDDILINNTFIEHALEEFNKDDSLDIINFRMCNTYNGVDILYKNSNINTDIVYSGINLAKIFKEFFNDYGLCGVYHKRVLKYFLSNGKLTNHSTISDEVVIMFKMLLNVNKIKLINQPAYCYTRDNEDQYSRKNDNSIYKSIKNSLNFFDNIYPILIENNLFDDEFQEMFNKNIYYLFEEAYMNFNITKNDDIFNKLLLNIDKNKKIYIYGKGEVGISLFKFLNSKNLKVIKFIDDNYHAEDIIKLNEFNVEESYVVIIASYKNSLIHKIYKQLIEHNINSKNILELV